MYESRYVVCPFYRRNESNRICCEGIDKTNTLNIVFGSQRDLHKYVIRYCNDIEGHKRCLLCQMLTKKWEDKQ